MHRINRAVRRILQAARQSVRQSTRLREQNQALQSEVHTLRTALEHVGHGIHVLDHHGKIILANTQAAKLLGVDPAYLATKPHFAEVAALQWTGGELASAQDELRQHVQSILAESPTANPIYPAGLYRRQRPDGTWIEVQATPLPGGGSVRTHTDVTERTRSEQRIADLANIDAVTGLATRANFQVQLEHAVQRDQGTALLVLDIDCFKDVNDLYGHPTGDRLLQELANRLRTAAYGPNPGPTPSHAPCQTPVLARIGGDEFAVILSPIEGQPTAERLAIEIIELASEPFDLPGCQLASGINVGIAFIPAPMPDLHSTAPALAADLMQQADLALNAAKSGGRSTCCTFTPALRQRHKAEQRLIEEIRAAIAHQQFDVYYQPVIDLGTLRVSAVEALLRWRHPTRGLLAAGAFINAAENSGLIVPLGDWALHQACRDAATWPSHVRLLVNVSPRQLASSHFNDIVGNALAQTGLAPTRLELEITETALLYLPEPAGLILQDLQRLGLRIALDDFGTGQSSLSHIRLAPIDTIKIDRSFIAEGPGRTEAQATLPSRKDCTAIVHAILGLAKELGIRTIGEGVEQPGQLEWLKAAGCTEVQGFLFSQARPAAEIPPLLTAPLPIPQPQP